jgi:hypothetical protein
MDEEEDLPGSGENLLEASETFLSDAEMFLSL